MAKSNEDKLRGALKDAADSVEPSDRLGRIRGATGANMRRRLALAVLGAVLLASATACDSRPCLQGHDEYLPVTSVGPKGQVTITYVWTFVCDKYGPKPTKSR